LADGNKIHGTPTIFVGDKMVPERLSYEDIVYYLLRV
jgi:protein-disulfide isomerase